MRLFTIAIFSLLSSCAFSQTISLDSISNYLRGAWQLKHHYYSIAGLSDTFPTLNEDYHFVFSEVDSDSMIRIDAYNNFDLIKFEEAKMLNPYFFSVENWTIDVMPSVIDGWPWSPMFVSSFSLKDTMYLSEHATDGSYLTMIRSDFLNEVKNLDEENSAITLCPNPTHSDYVFVKASHLKEEIINFKILDLSGKQILEMKNHTISTGIPIDKCPSGILIIKIECDGKIYTSKIFH